MNSIFIFGIMDSIVFLLLSLFMSYKQRVCDCDHDGSFLFFGILSFWFKLFSALFAILCVLEFGEMKVNTKINTAVQDGYTVYLDGSEIKDEHIDFTKYKVSIDEENKKIQLTRK